MTKKKLTKKQIEEQGKVQVILSRDDIERLNLKIDENGEATVEIAPTYGGKKVDALRSKFTRKVNESFNKQGK